jgi:type IV pilus assembly protein PilN
MIRINLLPVRQAKKKEQGRQQLVLLAGVFVLAVALSALWWWSTSSTLAEKKAQVARRQSEIQQLEKIIGEVNNINKEKKAVEEKLAVLEKLKKGRTGPVKVMDALATLMPKRAWLISLEEKGGRVTLKGGAVTNEDLADLISELKKSPFFQGPTLKKAVQRGDKGQKFIEYEIGCGVNYSA